MLFVFFRANLPSLTGTSNQKTFWYATTEVVSLQTLDW